jgi:hypothetical protein
LGLGAGGFTLHSFTHSRLHALSSPRSPIPDPQSSIPIFDPRSSLLAPRSSIPNPHDPTHHPHFKCPDLSALRRINFAVGEADAPAVVAAGDLVVVVDQSARKRCAAMGAAVLDRIKTSVFRPEYRHVHPGMRNNLRSTRRQFAFATNHCPFKIIHKKQLNHRGTENTEQKRLVASIHVLIKKVRKAGRTTD